MKFNHNRLGQYVYSEVVGVKFETLSKRCHFLFWLFRMDVGCGGSGRRKVIDILSKTKIKTGMLIYHLHGPYILISQSIILIY